MDKEKIHAFRHHLRIVILLLFIGIYTHSNAKPYPSTSDSTLFIEQRAEVDFRIPDKTKIKKFKGEKEFQYQEKEQKNPNISWLQRFFDWLFSRSSNSLDQNSETSFWKYLAYFFLLALALFIIFKLFKVKFKAIWGKQKVATPEDEINIYSDNVHEMNLDELVQSAIADKTYRLAVRYLYLRNLKSLSDAEIIVWSPNKTNMSYYNEMKDVELRKYFLQTALIFDYVWYGELQLNENEFNKAHAELDSLNKMIGNER